MPYTIISLWIKIEFYDRTNQNQIQTEVSTNEIMILVKHMVIKEELKELEEKLDCKIGKLGSDLRQEMNTEIGYFDAVDIKLSHLKGDLVVLMRKEDKKVVALRKF